MITSSDEEHDSHFLLPGFFKILGNNKNNEKEKTNKSSSPVPNKEQSEVPEKSSSSSTPTSPSQQTEKPQESSSTSIKEQKPNSPSQSSATSHNGTIKSASENSSTNQQQPQPQQCVPPSNIQKPTVRDQDESIRRLLHYYRIDDGDIVEVADGPAKRVVLLHPERPLPAYIQQNPELLKNIQRGS